MPLSDKGQKEAEAAGGRLRELIGEETVRFFVSPYLRSKQTFEHLLVVRLLASLSLSLSLM